MKPRPSDGYPLIPPSAAADARERAMVNALQVSELAVPGPVSSSQATAVPPARPCVVSCEVGPADRQALLDLSGRSSPDTRRSRFHQALSVFPQRYLDEILTGRQLTLVARDTCQEETMARSSGLPLPRWSPLVPLNLLSGSTTPGRAMG
jgi:hypothetical protein